MQREDLLRHWDDAWTGGLWYAPWSKVLEGLTAEQAAWAPQIGPGGRHSIWQIVNHMIFWREDAVRRFANDKPSAEERDRRNFEAPAAIDEESWAAAKRRFAKSYEQVRFAMAEPANALDRLQYLAPHDSYHIGQIMYIRALLGLEAIE